MHTDPIKVVQFGEGNFLRGFMDWMIQTMNDQDLFHGRVAVCVPIPGKKDEPWASRHCEYTLAKRGIVDGQIVHEQETITCIDQVLGCYEDFDTWLGLAEIPSLKLIISNTTEAGIAYVPSDRPTMRPPSSFPAKLTVFLYKRFSAGLPGVIVLPCELIENNAKTLKGIILQYAADWDLGNAFIEWLSSCTFVSSLVDRIVTGFPRDPAVREQLFAEIGFEDPLADIIEPYHLLVLEPVSPDSEKAIASLREELPFVQAGLNVIWTNDLTPYRTRKVRILNGAHTSTSLAALLAGLKTVEDFMKDPDFSAFLKKELNEEILPTINLPADEMKTYTDAVMERFLNPFLNHQLSSIALNSVSKWKSRLLPTLKDRRPANAPCICFSLAALLAFYVQGHGNDSEEVLAAFDAVKNLPAAAIAGQILSREDFWGEDLTELDGLYPQVASALERILSEGIRAAIPR